MPATEEPELVTGTRLLRLGLVLAVIPFIGGIPQVIGQSPTGSCSPSGPSPPSP